MIFLILRSNSRVCRIDVVIAFYFVEWDRELIERLGASKDSHYQQVLTNRSWQYCSEAEHFRHHINCRPRIGCNVL
jgi:hypothetical protein